MKLILTSSGIGSRKIKQELGKMLSKPPKENRVLIMFQRRKKTAHYLKLIKKQLRVKRKNLILVDLNKKLPKLPEFDIFYSCGGNTFFILDRVKKLGLDKIIKKFIKNNGIYIGTSAGSIIVHKTIAMAGWGSQAEENKVKLKNLKGIGLVNTAVFPHYTSRLKKEVLAFKKKVTYLVLELRDKEALIINNKKIKIIRRN